jgi:hypothetical protein
MQEVQGNSIFIENLDSGRLSERKQARGSTTLTSL